MALILPWLEDIIHFIFYGYMNVKRHRFFSFLSVCFTFCLSFQFRLSVLSLCLSFLSFCIFCLCFLCLSICLCFLSVSLTSIKYWLSYLQLTKGKPHNCNTEIFCFCFWQKEKEDRQTNKGQTVERNHRVINFAFLYTIIKNKLGDIFLSGRNQCHSIGVKKSYFGCTFHLTPKKFSGGGVGWLVVHS